MPYKDLSQLMSLGYLSDRRPCSQTCSMEVVEGSSQKSDI